MVQCFTLQSNLEGVGVHYNLTLVQCFALQSNRGGTLQSNMVQYFTLHSNLSGGGGEGGLHYNLTLVHCFTLQSNLGEEGVELQSNTDTMFYITH